jgi:hypothetical protein
VKHIDVLVLFERCNTKRSLGVAAEYVESSKTLQTLDLRVSRYQYSHEACEMISDLLRALSRNKSVTKLIIDTDSINFASEAFQEVLTCMQTLQKMALIYGLERRIR